MRARVRKWVSECKIPREGNISSSSFSSCSLPLACSRQRRYLLARSLTCHLLCIKVDWLCGVMIRGARLRSWKKSENCKSTQHTTQRKRKRIGSCCWVGVEWEWKWLEKAHGGRRSSPISIDGEMELNNFNQLMELTKKVRTLFLTLGQIKRRRRNKADRLTQVELLF